MLGQQHEPAEAEEGGVDDVDERVDDVEPGESEVLQRRLVRADVWCEVEAEDQDADAVDVHAELQGVEVVAGEEREDAVEAADFVDEECENRELSAGAERD